MCLVFNIKIKQIIKKNISRQNKLIIAIDRQQVAWFYGPLNIFIFSELK